MRPTGLCAFQHAAKQCSLVYMVSGKSQERELNRGSMPGTSQAQFWPGTPLLLPHSTIPSEVTGPTQVHREEKNSTSYGRGRNGWGRGTGGEMCSFFATCLNIFLKSNYKPWHRLAQNKVTCGHLKWEMYPSLNLVISTGQFWGNTDRISDIWKVLQNFLKH